MTIDPALLRPFGVFSAFDDRALGALSAVFVARSFDDGAVLVEQGSRRGGLFLVLSGRVRVQRRLPEGHTVDLMHVGPGSFVGVLAVMDGAERGANCIAAGAVECAELPRAEAHDLVNGRTPLALRFQLAAIREMFGDLRRTNQRLTELATLPEEAIGPLLGG